MRPLCLAFVCSLFAAGCYPVVQLQGPRTLPEGDVQLTAAPVLSFDRVSEGGGDGVLPAPALAARVGLRERWDVGLVLQLSSLQVGAKYQLLRGEVDLALSEAVVLAQDGDHGFDNEHPLVTDLALVLASKTAFYVGLGGDGALRPWIAPTLDLGVRQNRDGVDHYSEPFAAAGVLLGCSFELGMLRIQPELGIVAPFAGKTRMQFANGPQTLRLSKGDLRGEATLALSLVF